jgi:hypothetical protein
MAENPVEETAEIELLHRKLIKLGQRLCSEPNWIPLVKRKFHCVDYLASLGENE